MTPQEYIQNVKRSESSHYHPIPSRILHGAIGCCTEAGEILDVMHKAIFYERSLDRMNLKEEIGDLLWYIGILCDSCGWSIEEVMEQNIAKLRIRYPEQFSKRAEQSRDYTAEAKVFTEPENDERAA